MNKYQYFKSLHFSDEGLFLGGTYDVLSAMVLEKAGFRALGTTSWGVANTFGLRDVMQHSDLLSQIRAKLDKNGFKDFFINARTEK